MARTTTTKTPAKAPSKPAAPPKTTKPVAGPAPSRGGRTMRFLREVRVEMSKVTWPPRQELIQATMVVIVAVAIAAAYIGVFDLIWSSLVNLARLG
ncbi:MAG TPA: preprotein translocase subunit SecE [Thermoleophilia bacterium]|nr:preprotein translocase subunit SecE [Thermoleophilia bacterium]